MNIQNLFSIKFYVVCLVVCILGVFYLLGSPVHFPVDSVFHVAEGRSLRGVSLDLKNQNIIRSRFMFETFAVIFNSERKILSGYYSLEKKLPVFEVARRIALNDKRMPPVKVTFPEGFDSFEIANLLNQKLPNFDKDAFLEKAKDYEGYLFPDTYFFSRDEKIDNILKIFENNYQKRIKNLQLDIEKSGRSESDIIKMASLIEKEAKGEEDREVISGILWKRISIGMALQADASPETYEKRGLPSAPIANPGLESIKASIYPKSSPYLFYLHDKNGKIYYARNFDEHRKNIEKYLK